MNEELLSIQDLMSTLKRYRGTIALCVPLCLGLAIGVSQVLPKKFKSTALLNIQATYFDIPLIGDSIVGSREATEMQAQKQALIRLAINDKFIDQEGEKYKLFKSALNTPARNAEREGLRKSIDYFSSSATTFQFTVTGRSSESAYGIANDLLDQIVTVLVSERQKSIITYRDSLRRQVESLGVAMNAASPPSPGAQPQVLKEELAGLEAKLAALSSQYTHNHPSVVAMRQRVESVRQMLARSGGTERSGSHSQQAMLLDSASKGRRGDFAEELLKKINYLDIALQLESNKTDLPYLEILERPVPASTYFFPKTTAFAVGGLILGFLLAGLRIGYAELKRATVMTPMHMARQLGIPYLGALPVMLKGPSSSSSGPDPSSFPMKGPASSG